MPHDLQPPEGADQATQTVAADDQEPMLWCPVCSTRLEQKKCKLFCQKCGYYMSCADYY